jgi:hypothetical protein
VGERQVRDDTEGLSGHAEVARIARNDAHARIAPEPLPQTRHQRGLDLDRDDAARARRELRGQDARTGTDLDDEIAADDAGVADEVSGEARDEEVLTGPGA